MQIAVCAWVLFYGPKWFGFEEGHLYTKATGAPSEHHTVLFNVLVIMTLFNEINCRKLYGEANVFQGIFDNFYFCLVLAVTFVLQCLAAQFGGRWIKCYVGGLTLGEWTFCLLCGLAVLVWQFVVNAVARLLMRITSTQGASHESGLLKFKSGTGNGMIRMRNTSKSVDVRSAKSRDEGRRQHLQRRNSKGGGSMV